MKNPIGFSTGALAHGAFVDALKMLAGTSADAVELSALRAHELSPLLDALPKLDLKKYRHVSIHAPKKPTLMFPSRPMAKALEERAWLGPEAFSYPSRDRRPCFYRERWWDVSVPVIVHRETIDDSSHFRQLEERLTIENTTEDFDLFENTMEFFPRARFCLDMAHAFLKDPSGWLFRELLSRFRRELVEVHLSVCGPDGQHRPLHTIPLTRLFGFVRELPDNVPIILEGETDWTPESMEREMAFVRDLLGTREAPRFVVDAWPH